MNPAITLSHHSLILRRVSPILKMLTWSLPTWPVFDKLALAPSLMAILLSTSFHIETRELHRPRDSKKPQRLPWFSVLPDSNDNGYLGHTFISWGFDSGDNQGKISFFHWSYTFFFWQSLFLLLLCGITTRWHLHDSFPCPPLIPFLGTGRWQQLHWVEHYVHCRIQDRFCRSIAREHSSGRSLFRLPFASGGETIYPIHVR